ncbi:unnamed protein product [Ilex paraguariensis]|uniref:Uncharacterized protein n=1 Tax=Ilex paraguariensis TaxID=185542 RepID=A0ABC8R0M6_9AQUA
MHGLSRLGNGAKSPSPPSSPRFRHGRTKNTVNIGGGGSFRGGGGELKLQNVVERVVYVVIWGVYRRRGVLLVAPLLYISGMLLYMGTLGFDVVGSNGGGHKAGPPGSVYRSPQVFERLWSYMEAESNNGTSNVLFGCLKSTGLFVGDCM